MKTGLPEFAERLILAVQDGSSGVRLVGGAGLAILLEHRTSEDIDLFCESAADIPVVVSNLDAAAAAEGARLVSVRTAPTFRRFDVVGGVVSLRVDIAVDSSPLLEPEFPPVGGIRVLSPRDQRANKIVTLLGRSELRDLIDLYCLEQAGWPMLEGLEDALLKDNGVDFAWLAWAMSQIDIRPLPGLRATIDPEKLARFRQTKVEHLLDLAGSKSEK